MIFLKMYIGNVLVEKYRLDYTGMTNCTEIESYQCGIADGMYKDHIKKINLAGIEPKFFVEKVESKMNDEDFVIVLSREEKERFRNVLLKQRRLLKIE